MKSSKSKISTFGPREMMPRIYRGCDFGKPSPILLKCDSGFFAYISGGVESNGIFNKSYYPENLSYFAHDASANNLGTTIFEGRISKKSIEAAKAKMPSSTGLPAEFLDLVYSAYRNKETAIVTGEKASPLLEEPMPTEDETAVKSLDDIYALVNASVTARAAALEHSISEDLSESFKRIMKEESLSFRGLAKLMNTSPAAVVRLIRNSDGSPTLLTLCRAAIALNKTLKVTLGDEIFEFGKI